MSSPVLAGLMGLCVGDALGVPVEFTSREERDRTPVTTMQGFGTWNQPPGTWSDDSSLAFCLAESLCTGFDLQDMGDRFCGWFSEADWSAHGQVFDIGGTTVQAIRKLQRGVNPVDAGGTNEQSNGNGSLMRILPLAFQYKQVDLPTLIQRTHQVSCLTHAHPRSQLACGIYISIATQLLQGQDLETAYNQGWEQVAHLYQQSPFVEELTHFDCIIKGAIAQVPRSEIQAGGYVVHTLEAALWCLLNTSSYAEAVLSAVNLGEDTDTTAAVTGGLAGLHYGFDAIPTDWVNTIARKDDIVNLATRLQRASDQGA